MASVEFRSVRKAFGDRTVIPNLDLTVHDGELLVLLGPSGCGKSTLLRLLAGLEQASGGEILIGERPVDALGPRERNVAMVFQNYALYPHLTVRGNLEFPLRMRGLGRAERERRVLDAAEALGLDAFLNARPAELSGGQRQRVAMGRAIVREPDVFLMDEPLSNLDARLRVQIRAEIGALQRRHGVTTLYVTHDQVEAMTLGDRVAVMREGMIQQLGPPGTLYDAPANLFVAGFLGSPPMNVFEPAFEWRGGEQVVHLGGRWLQPPRAIPDAAHYAGLRPEAFTTEATPARDRDTPGQVAIRGSVEALEVLGHERIVHVRAEDRVIQPIPGPVDADDSGLLAARLIGGPELERGSNVTLFADPGRILWFDQQGNSIEPRN